MLTALVTAVIFLVMISLHEFGHFAVAKLCGIKVNEYSIGMGPAIFKKQGKNTLYSLRILPIGGYCKMEGEDGESDDNSAFCNQKLYKRFLTVLAGAILNIILGLVIFVLVNTKAAPYATNIIKSLDERAGMYQIGILPGDEIININGHKVSYYQDIELYKSEIDDTNNVTMTVMRDGKKLKFVFPMSRMVGQYDFNKDGYTLTTTMNGIETIEEYKLENGNTIPDDMVGTTQKVDSMMLGFSPVTEKFSVGACIYNSYCDTKFVVRLVYKSLWDMISGKTGLEQVSGPVGIVNAVNDAVNSDARWMSVLFLSALLTINLGVFNLLPLPALDGGRLFFMIVEFFRGKPVPPEKEGMVHTLGLLALLIFTFIISAKDIIMLFK